VQGLQRGADTSELLFLSAGGFGLGIQAHEKIHSYSPDGRQTSSRSNAVATLGKGFVSTLLKILVHRSCVVTPPVQYRAYNQRYRNDS
jgi:hypothetical protein